MAANFIYTMYMESAWFRFFMANSLNNKIRDSGSKKQVASFTKRGDLFNSMI